MVSELSSMLPSHPERVLIPSKPVFNKRPDYNQLVDKLKAKQDEEIFWSEVRKRVPLTGERLGCAMRGLKTRVGFDLAEVWLVGKHSQIRGLKRPPTIHNKAVKKGNKQPVWTQESGLSRRELLQWVDEHWEECKKLERDREKRANEEKQRHKQKS